MEEEQPGEFRLDLGWAWSSGIVTTLSRQDFGSSVCPLGSGRLSLSLPTLSEGRRERDTSQRCHLPAQEDKQAGLHPEGVGAG